jgi:hypothetical protein
MASARSSTSSSASRANPSEHAGDARAREGAAAIESGLRDADLLLPSVSRQSDGRVVGGTRVCLPRGLEQWADFDYVAGRGPWITPAQWQQVERFKFYTRHAWNRARGDGRCVPRRSGDANHDWYSLPVEKLIVDFVRPPQQVS